MATVTRVHGTYPNFTTGTLRSTSQLKGFIITVKDDSAAVALTAKDGDATDGSEPDQLVELLIKELNPLMYEASTGSTGVIYVIMDGHANDADSIKARLVPIIVGDGNGTVAGNLTTVAVASNIVLS